MSEMGDWIAELQRQGVFTRPGGEGPFPPPGDRVAPPLPEKPYPDRVAPELPVKPPVSPAPGQFVPELPDTYGAPPWAGNPNIPAPLADFLRWYQSGHSTGVTPEMYDYFRGGDMLTALQQFDPNARWVDTDLGGGEGATSVPGRRLEYNQGALPAGAGPGWMSPVSLNSDRLRNPGMQYYDPVYGWVTDPRNVYHDKPAWWEYAAPLAISMFAPMAGAALAGAGIGAAGGTAAVTGGAAGLGASNIAMGGAPTWWSNWLGKVPRAVGPILSGPPSAPTTNPRPMGPPIARNQQIPDPYGFDPTAFNSGGSSTKPSSNDSKLVATQFADDPYRFSKGY